MKQCISKGVILQISSTGLPIFWASFCVVTKPTNILCLDLLRGSNLLRFALSRHPGSPNRTVWGSVAQHGSIRPKEFQVCPKNPGFNLETYSINPILSGWWLEPEKSSSIGRCERILRENRYQWNLDDSLLCWTCMYSFGEECPTISCSSVSWIHFLTNVFEIYLLCSPLTNSNMQYPNDPSMEYLHLPSM